MKYKLLPFLILGITGIAQADHCQHVQQVVQAVTYQPVAQAIVVPAYFATYAPQALSSPVTQNLANEDVLRQILEELKALNSKLDKMNPTIQQPMTGLTPLEVMKTNCAACHAGSASTDKGGGFSLFDNRGNLVELSPADRRRIVNRVSKNSMPPPESKKVLTPQEKEAIINLVK